MHWLASAIERRRRRRGRVLAVKAGLNPNSSSLGVDVTFLLFGAAALSLATPVIAALLQLRRPGRAARRRGETEAGPGAGEGEGEGSAHAAPATPAE